jgi:hypothetical protein
VSSLSKLAAIWISPHDWYLSATGPQDTVACEVHADHWTRRPTFRDPVKLVDWALSVARGNESPPPSTGRSLKFTKTTDDDKILRFALLLSPEACDALGVGTPPDGDTHPWIALFEAAGWNVRTRTVGPWLTLERRDVEIGVLLVGWLDRGKPRELAGHGITLAATGHIDAWGSCYVHGEYRRLTGWPLSAGAGMAALKGLWRSHRTTRVTWVPKGPYKSSAEYWQSIPPIALGRAHRPWHLHWTAHPAFNEPIPAGRVALWDANADYLVAWTVARFARGVLTHTGPDPVRPHSGRPAAGYYLIDSLTWAPQAQYVADRLPPVWGSRTPNPDGAVWVTHIILDLLDSLRHEEHPPPTYRILDSYTCDNSGQLARPWGERLKAALLAAREEAARERSGPEDTTLAEALKQSYARGYMLLENAGIIARHDHVDTLIDQRYLSAYKRMWLAAWNEERYPLDVSADEIVYLYRDGDEEHGPLGEPHDTAYGHYKIKRRGTLEEWHTSHQDGRSGHWWLPIPDEPAPSVQPAPAASDAPSHDESAGGWLGAILGD